MQAISQAVSVAVATAMKEMNGGGGGGGRPNLQNTVENTVKRMDKLHKEHFNDWKFKLEMGLRGSYPRLAELVRWAEEQDGRSTATCWGRRR